MKERSASELREIRRMIVIVALSLALSACVHSRDSRWTPAPWQAYGRIELRLRFGSQASPPGDRVVVWWETETEQRRKGPPSFALFVRLLSRYRVISLDRAGSRRPIDLALTTLRLSSGELRN